jgi:hypothetical protein
MIYLLLHSGGLQEAAGKSTQEPYETEGRRAKAGIQHGLAETKG